jgi:serine/threonine-protein kinase RsbW
MKSDSENSPEPSHRVKEDFEVDLNIPSDLELIRMVVDLGASLMEIRGYSDDDRHSIRLAIHETLINAIRHGSINHPNARVSVHFSFKDQCFHTDIEDEGAGFDLKDLPDPTAPENLLKNSGRGIFMVRQLTENFTVERLPNHGVRVSFCRFKQKNNSDSKEM